MKHKPKQKILKFLFLLLFALYPHLIFLLPSTCWGKQNFCFVFYLSKSTIFFNVVQYFISCSKCAKLMFILAEKYSISYELIVINSQSILSMNTLFNLNQLLLCIKILRYVHECCFLIFVYYTSVLKSQSKSTNDNLYSFVCDFLPFYILSVLGFFNYVLSCVLLNFVCYFIVDLSSTVIFVLEY